MEKESNFGRKGELGRKQKEGGGSGIDRGKKKKGEIQKLSQWQKLFRLFENIQFTPKCKQYFMYFFSQLFAHKLDIFKKY